MRSLLKCGEVWLDSHRVTVSHWPADTDLLWYEHMQVTANVSDFCSVSSWVFLAFVRAAQHTNQWGCGIFHTCVQSVIGWYAAGVKLMEQNKIFCLLMTSVSYFHTKTLFRHKMCHFVCFILVWQWCFSLFTHTCLLSVLLWASFRPDRPVSCFHWIIPKKLTNMLLDQVIWIN